VCYSECNKCAMAFVKKGQKWPNKAAEYPRHPDWLTIDQAAELLGVSRRSVEHQLFKLKTLTGVRKEWRYGCWCRAATFLSRYEVEALKVRMAVRKKANLKGKSNLAAPLSVVAVNPLRQWRKAQGLSGAEVGERLGVGEWLIAGWEHGRSDPDEPHMVKVAALLGSNLEDLRMRWAAWRILMLDPIPAAKRLPIDLNFSPKEPHALSEEIPDEAA
jgi:transcriptional regulator with XRE-family HTH domain